MTSGLITSPSHSARPRGPAGHQGAEVPDARRGIQRAGGHEDPIRGSNKGDDLSDLWGFNGILWDFMGFHGHFLMIFSGKLLHSELEHDHRNSGYTQ